MGSLVRLGDWLDAERVRSGTVRQREARLRRGIVRERRRLAGEIGAAVRTARRAVPPAAIVVTFSRSETVRRALASLRGAKRPREIRCLRSEPGGEGAGLAESLFKIGLPARVFEDRDARRTLDGASLVLVGADTVYRDGALVHKVGTRSLARHALDAEVPLVSITGRSKIVDRTAPQRWRGPARFDLTPPRFVRAYWTDAGVRAPGRLILPRTRSASSAR
jgi:translation initiation factor 2B subunit (eIF-2B alpha/beta/delta family)